MTGRRGLTLVTALTVGSLLLGGGALNALAEEHGNNGQHGEGGDRGNSKHQQHPAPAVVNQTTTVQGKHDDEDGEDRPSMHAPLVPAQVTVRHEDNNKNNNNNSNNVQRKHEDDDEDLVTAPVRVTDNARPDDDNKENNNKHEDSNNNHQDDNDNQGDD